MKQQLGNATLPPSRLMMHNNSRTICKEKPKIRIIHIVAPEIIRTDVEHFRELVQRLTGKPEERPKSKTDKGNNMSSPNTNGSKPSKNVTRPLDDSRMSQGTKRESEKIYGVENHNSFLSFLGDVDGFIHDINAFPLVPFRASQNDTFGEMPLC